ncbi:MAG: VIT domain-containing protein [Planctomycetota bacterium]
MKTPPLARRRPSVPLLLGVACLLLGTAVRAGQEQQPAAAALAADPALGWITDREGNAARRGVLQDRWDLAGLRARLQAGDWLRTGARGANALAFELAPEAGPAARLVLGPGGLVEIAARDRIVLIAGELSVDAPDGRAVRVDGPGDASIEVQGRAVLRAAQDALVRLDERPRWLVGYEGDASTEALGSLLANVDGRNVPLTIGYHDVTVDIRDQIARTVIEESFVNHTSRVLEGVFYFPLPADASISGFGMWIGDELVQGEIVEKQRARAIYETILRERRDPGLLEWSGGSVFKASVFPIGAEKRIRIAYTQVLPKTGEGYRYHYALRSEMLRKTPLRELRIEVRASSTAEIAGVTCPSHPCRIRATDHAASVEFEAQEFAPDRDFELRFETAPTDGTPTLVTHVRDGDGTFMLLVDAPEVPAPAAPDGTTEPLDLVVLADTSGSMAGPAREAQVAFVETLLGTLGPDDTLRLATCDAVTRWASDRPVPASQESREAALRFLDERIPLGWSNLDGAFAAVFADLRPGSHVVYVGDGTPTSGDADAVAFSQRLARDFPGSATFHAVVPGNRSEAVVTRAVASLGGGSVRSIGGGTDPAAVAFDLAREITSPSIGDLALRFEGLDVAAVYPERLPNLAAGGQQIVVGRFDPRGGATRGRAVLTGTLGGEPVAWPIEIALGGDPAGDGGNSFLPRLWARRHLDHLLAQGTSPAIRDRIVALSEDYQVLTPYTSFLVLETDEDRERFEVERAFRMRDGEEFFAAGRDDARHALQREQMRLAEGWRSELRAKAIARLAGLGRDLTELLGPGALAALGQEEVVFDVFEVTDHNETDGDAWSPAGSASRHGSRDGQARAGAYEDDDWLAWDAVEPLGEADPSPEDDGEQAAADAPFAESSSRSDSLMMSQPASGAPRRQTAFPATGGDALALYHGRTPQRPGAPRWRVGRFDQPANSSALAFTDLRWLFPFLADAPAPIEEPEWPEDVLDVVRALDRRPSIDALDGGLRFAVTTTSHLGRGRTSKRRGSQLVGSEAWVTRSSPAHGNNTSLQWFRGDEVGVIHVGTALGRVRPAREGDRTVGWSPLLWHFRSSLARYGHYQATAEELEGDRVRLTLTSPHDDSAIELTVDTARALVLEQAYLREGEVTQRIAFSDFVELAGTWWPTSIRPVRQDGAPVETAGATDTDIEISALDAAAFRSRVDAELEVRERAILLREEPDGAVAARQAVRDGTAGVDERWFLLLHSVGLQRWPVAREHFDALADLCTGRPGLEPIRWTFLFQSRRHDELVRRLLEGARSIAEAPRDGELGLVDLYLQTVQALGSYGERLRLLDAILPVLDRHPDRLRLSESWKSLSFGALRNMGRSAAALALLEQVLAEDPTLASFQVQYAQTLADRGETDRALAHLARIEADEGPWASREIRPFRAEAARILWKSSRLAEYVALFKRWERESLEHVGSGLADQYLSALFLLDREEEAWSRVDDWTAVEGWEALQRHEIDRLQAAVRHLLGRGHRLYDAHLPGERAQQLVDLCRELMALDDDHDLVRQIAFDHRLLATDEGRALAQELFATLRDGAETLPIETVVRYSNWLSYGRRVPGVGREEMDALQDALFARWKVAKEKEDRDALARLVLSGRRFELHARLFRHLATEPRDEDERLKGVRGLFYTLRQLPWSEERESELLGLVPRLDANEEEGSRRWEMNLDERILAVHDISTWIPRARALAAMEVLPDRNELTRRERKARRSEALRDARRAASAALATLEPTVGSPTLARWVAIERISLDVRTRTSIADARRDSLVLLEALAGEHAETAKGEVPPRDRVLAARCAATQTYLLTREGSEQRDENERAFRTLLDAGLNSGSDLLDWRDCEATLLLALDRGDALEARLVEWYAGGATVAQARWGRDLARVAVERGDLERGVALLRDVEELDELTHDDYRMLAGLQTALDRPDEAREAKVRSWEAVGEESLVGGLQAELSGVQRQGDGVPVELDEEVPLRLVALMRRAPKPSQWLRFVTSYYRATKDFRLLECLPEAVLGRSAGEVYDFLRSTWRLISKIQEDATVDRLVAHLRALHADASSDVDRRALRLLEFLVVQAATRKGVGAEGNADAALAALLAAEKGAWDDGEPRLMAVFLESAGAVQPNALAEAQLRILGALRAEAEDPEDRLAIAQSHANTLWAHGRRDDAIAALEGALRARRDAPDVPLPPDADPALQRLASWHESVGAYARAEELWRGELDLGPNLDRRLRLERGLFGLYRNAALAKARTSLGEGEEQYAAARDLLLEALARPTNEWHAQQLVGIATDLWGRGHKRLRFAPIPDDAAAFAFVHVPEILQRYHHREAQGIVGDVAACLREVREPLTALEFLVVRAESEPAWLRRRGGRESFWSRHGVLLASRKKDAGTLSTSLELRVLSIVLRALREDLENGHTRPRPMSDRRNRTFWAEKADEFERVALEVIESNRDSGATVARASEYLFRGLDAHDAAIDALATAHRRSVLDESGSHLLATFLQERERWEESIPVLVTLADGSLHPNDARVMRMRAHFHLGDRDALAAAHADAVGWLRENDLWSESVIGVFARACLETELFDEAIEHYREAIALQTRNAPNRGVGGGVLGGYYSQLAKTLSSLGRTDEAVDAAAGGIVAWGRGQSGRARALKQLEDVLRSAEDLDEYVARFEATGRAEGVENPILRRAIGVVYAERRRWEGAARALEIALESAPGDIDAYPRLVAAYDGMERPDFAADATLRWGRAAEVDASVFERLASRYEDLGRPDDAERALAQVVEARPHESEPHRALALELESRERWAEAEERWRNVIRIRTREPEGYAGVARTYLERGMADEARAAIDDMATREWDDRFDRPQIERTLEALRRKLKRIE